MNLLAKINSFNIYTKFFQKDDMKEVELPTNVEISKNPAKYKIYMKQNNYMDKFGYKKTYYKEKDFTLYTLKRRTKTNCLLYVPGYGRNFTIMNLNSLFQDNGMDLVGIDLPNYGNSYREKESNINYNTIDDIDKYFVALNQAIQKVKKLGYTKVILMGNSTGGLICTNYIMNKCYKKPDYLVLESPLLEFKDGEFPIPTNVANNISPLLYSLIPDLIINRDGDDPTWLRENPFFNDKLVPTKNRGHVDYWYNPLSNKPNYVSYLYNDFKMINNVASIDNPVTNMPILLFCNSKIDAHINVPVVIERVKQITTKPFIYKSDTYLHEIMLDKWSNITKCVKQIGKIVNK
jgi:alpha-beta hydrolase superfamily lysophospholipase